VASDLSSIPGLRPKHIAVLTGSLQIRTALDLVRADRRVVYAAMRRLRPAPTLEDIAGWQDHARDLAVAIPAELPGSPGWEQVAAFVVSFEVRQARGDPDRRLVVEQVEQAPPEPRREWPGWPRETAWTWMLERVAAEGGSAEPQPALRELTGQEPIAAARPASETPEPTSASHLGRVPPAITTGTPELVLATGVVRPLDAVGHSVDIPPSAALRITVTSEPGMTLHVALRLRRAGRPSHAPSPPVTAISGEAAEIDLDRLPAGEHAAVLTVWAPRGAAAAAVIPLPRLRVPEGP
jgi:hypothetical protein